jgi:hypothetical protein
MINLFAPYIGKKPAPVVINGHRLLIISQDKNALEDSLEVCGADNVKRLRDINSQADQEKLISSLARSINGGVVVAPEDVTISDLVTNLRFELPWIQ